MGNFIAPFWILLLLLAQPVYSQDQNNADLRSIIQIGKKDTVHLQALLDLGTALFRFEPDSTIYYSMKAQLLATELNDQKRLAYALKNIGLAYFIQGDYLEVLNYWKQSLGIFESIEDRVGESNLLSNIGAVYFNQGDHPRALDYYLKSLDISQELGNKLRIATALINIGAVYNEEEKTQDNALEFLLRALKISEELDDQETVGTSSTNIGEIYLNKKQYLPALFYFEKAVDAFKKTGGNIAIALNFIGKTYAAEKKYAKAIQYQREAYQTAKDRNAKSEMTKALVSLGDVYKEQRLFGQSIDQYNQAINLAEELDSRLDLQKAYSNLSEIYLQTNDYRKAFAFQRKLTSINDTIYNSEREWRVNMLQFQLDLEKKEGEIEILNKESDLHEVEIQRASILRNFLFAGAGFLLIIVFGVYYQYRFARKSNKIISEERNKSEKILLNILPKETAEELKQYGSVKAKKFDKVTVLFADIKHFTAIADSTPAENLVNSLDYYFRNFDEIMGRNNMEKIKTIGDAYMCAGGLPIPNKTNPGDAVKAAVEMIEFTQSVKDLNPEGILHFDFRIGIHTGPVLAGVVGTKKFQYDIWGNAVNIASRLESASVPGKINISESTYQEIKKLYDCEFRGEIEVKRGQKFRMYFLEQPAQVAV